MEVAAAVTPANQFVTVELPRAQIFRRITRSSRVRPGIMERQQVSRANCLSANIAGSMLRRRAMAGKSVMLKKLGGFPADRIDRE